VIQYVSDLDLQRIVSDCPEFFGLRLKHANQHNETLLFLTPCRFSACPKGELVNAVRVWLRSINIDVENERVWSALRTVGAEKERTYALLDARSL
jgi:hypothetical protein